MRFELRGVVFIVSFVLIMFLAPAVVAQEEEVVVVTQEEDTVVAQEEEETAVVQEDEAAVVAQEEETAVVKQEEKIVVEQEEKITVEQEDMIADTPKEEAVILSRDGASISRDERGLVFSMAGEVMFGFNKADLLEEHVSVLRKVAEILAEYTEIPVLIEGHTCTVGTEEYNLSLSLRRANAAKDFLVSHGVAADRLTVVGLGFSKPVAENDTEEGRSKNRRIEFIVEETDVTGGAISRIEEVVTGVAPPEEPPEEVVVEEEPPVEEPPVVVEEGPYYELYEIIEMIGPRPSAPERWYFFSVRPEYVVIFYLGGDEINSRGEISSLGLTLEGGFFNDGRLLTANLSAGANYIGGDIDFGYLVYEKAFWQNILGVCAGYHHFAYNIKLKDRRFGETETETVGKGRNAAFAGLFWKITLGSRIDITNKLMFGRTDGVVRYDGDANRISEDGGSLTWSIGVGYPFFIRRGK